MEPKQQSTGVGISGGDVDSQNTAGRDIVIEKQTNIYQQGQTPPPKPRSIYLPLKPTNVVERAYFEKLRAVLLDAEAGMFLLSGEPGSGKSTLAQMFAWQVHRRFEAVIYQTCGQRGMATIIGELADTLKQEIGEQVTQLPTEQKLEAIKHWLQQRRSLLVLDDVWLNDSPGNNGTNARELQNLLPGPPVSVLFTSRRPALPWVRAEHRVHVEAFTPEEVEDTFRLYLGAQTVERNRTELLQFAESSVSRWRWQHSCCKTSLAHSRKQHEGWS